MRLLTIILALSISAIAYPLHDPIEERQEAELADQEEDSSDACYVPGPIENEGAVGQHGHSSFHQKSPTTSSSMITSSAASISIPTITSSSDTTATDSSGSLSTFTLDVSSSTITNPVPTGNISASLSTAPGLPTNAIGQPTSSTTSSTTSTAPSQSAQTTSSTPPTVPSQSAQPTALRGVNIGHWLVIEPWMDDGQLMSGKFKNAADQWTFDTLDTDGSAIKQHWDTWFTQGDVQRLKNYGFNALRIPIGYWAFNNENTPYRKGAIEYMDQAIVWARRIGMKIMIDCHASPGSQNGQMHSGHQGVVKWQSGNNLNLSTEVLQQMVQRWGTVENADTVFAIEIVSTYNFRLPPLSYTNIYIYILTLNVFQMNQQQMLQMPLPNHNHGPRTHIKLFSVPLPVAA